MKEREYLKELGKKITDSSVRKEIVNEYEAHIEDCKAALMESGMTEVEAEEEAVRQMGDPQEAGEAMDKIYHKVFDSNMFLWMLALGCVPIVCVCISYLIARDPNAFLWLWNDALGLNKIPAVIHRNIGIGLAVYGNSGLVLFISALCFAPSFPVKGYAGILCCVLIACLLNMVLRGFMNLLQSRRETRLLWEIGTADTRINWKGKGYLCGHHMKVRVQGSEKGTEITAGAPVMVVGMEGFKPVVAQV